MFSQLDDLDFADDLALLSHSHKQIQEKTDRLNYYSHNLGLQIHSNKTKVLRMNATDSPVMLQGKPIEDVDRFTYLGSVIDEQGGASEDIKVRIQKARGAFVLLQKIWKSKVLSVHTKLRIFKSNVKPVLLYGSETWKLTTTLSRKLQSFTNRPETNFRNKVV